MQHHGEMNLDVWVDIACPWCAIGERRLHEALASVPFEPDVTVRYRAYQLQPDAPEHSHVSQ